MTRRHISVLVVGDDTASNRVLRQVLEAEGDIAVVAESPVERGLRAAHAHAPDLIALQMPGSQHEAGPCLDAIRQVMGHLPTPILLITPAGGASESCAPAVAAGALEAMARPESWDGGPAVRVRRLARTLSSVTVLRHPGGRTAVASARAGTPVVAIAASTGGPQALARVLGDLGGLEAAVLVVQHIHEDFVEGLVTLMRRASALPVELADAGRPLREGVVHVAPANRHLRLGPHRRAMLTLEPVSIHRPSADVLFQSVAEHAGGLGIGVVLTGMGEDGTAGLLALRRAGGVTIGQDEASCAVYGMPRAAHLAGALSQVTPLDAIGAAVRRAVAVARR